MSLKKHSAFVSILFSLLHLDVKAEITTEKTGDEILIADKASSFGMGPEIVLHDDFDSGKVGQPLQNWSLSAASPAQLPSYSDVTSVTGPQSGMSSFLDGNYNSSAEYKNLPSLESVYLSYYFKVDLIKGLPSRNIKLARLSGGHAGNYLQAAGFTFYGNHSNGQFLMSSVDFAESKFKPAWTSNYVDGKWHRVQQFIKLSTPAKTATGTTIVKLDQQVVSNEIDIINEESGMRYKWLTLPYYVAHDQGGDYKIFYDNVVVSKNRARVELCERDDYEDCKQPIIPRIISWTPSSIRISTENLSSKRPYIFIFDHQDKLVTKPVHFCPRCPGNPSPK